MTGASVTAIVPTYNRAALACRAVESILAQGYPDIEVVVVDDGSQDDTLQRLERFGSRIRVIPQANQGVCAARNAGITAAGGTFIAFLDSDDWWQPWKIGAQVAAFKADPSVVLAWTDVTSVDSAGRVVEERALRRFYGKSFGYLPESALFQSGRPIEDLFAGAPAGMVWTGDFSSSVYLGNFFHLSSVMVRRSVLDSVGRFDPRVGNAGEDYELFSRIVQQGSACLVDAPGTVCTMGLEGSLSGMRSHTALANRMTMEKIKKLRPAGLTLPEETIARRQRDAAVWAGLALFDEDRHPEARPHLLDAVAGGARNARVLASLALTYAPLPVTRFLRGLKHRITP